MTTEWQRTLTEDRYATHASRHLRAMLAELKPGPLADEVSLPAGVAINWEGSELTFTAAVPALLELANEFRKLARSPSRSIAQLDDVRFEVDNELEGPGTPRTVRLPWYAWHPVAQACESFATYGRQMGHTIRFDLYNFFSGKWLRD